MTDEPIGDGGSRFASRKFAAYMVSNLLMKILIFWAMYTKQDDLIQMTLIITSGCVDIGYILGQAALDAFLGWANNLIHRVPSPPAEKPKLPAPVEPG
jgi:hypothetical protein